MQYIAFLRGINVGGNSLIKMAELREALARDGFTDARTYIQSGNVLFASNETDTNTLAVTISATILKHFQLTVDAVVHSASTWKTLIEAAPSWWGQDKEWKHNLLILLPPLTAAETLEAMGAIKPKIEAVQTGSGVVYQSMSFKDFGRTTYGKLASNSVYKHMPIRNYNTATKLAALLD